MKPSDRITKSFQRLTFLTAAALLASGGSLLAQGFLIPPPNGSLPLGDQALDALGAPESNMKSLTQTDPGQPIPSKDPNLPALNGSAGSYLISVSGNYYLTENLVGDAPIVITTSNVTVDLRGYEMRFVPSGGPGGPAISVSGGAGPMPQRIHVRNGFVTGEWSDGVVLPDYCSVRDVNVSGVMGFGIAAGSQSTIHNCIVHGMDLAEGTPGPHAGIFGGAGAVISNSTAREIHGMGIEVDRDGRIVDCTANCVLGHGFVAADGATLEGCTSHMNLLNGYETRMGCTLTDCTAVENFAVGFHSMAGSVFSHCVSRLNQAEGYLAEGEIPGEPRGAGAIGHPFTANGTSFLHCSATRNLLDGFQTTVNSTFTHCTADHNGSDVDDGAGGVIPTGDGFDVIDSCRLVNCMASHNFVHGIAGLEDNYAEQNTCHTNGGFGLFFTATANTVIKNYVKFNVAGPIAPGAGVGGIAPLVMPSAAAPNPFGNFFF